MILLLLRLRKKSKIPKSNFDDMASVKGLDSCRCIASLMRTCLKTCRRQIFICHRQKNLLSCSPIHVVFSYSQHTRSSGISLTHLLTHLFHTRTHFFKHLRTHTHSLTHTRWLFRLAHGRGRGGKTTLKGTLLCTWTLTQAFFLSHTL